MAGVQGTTTGAPGGLLGHPGVDDVPSEQVRFAVVLNGGVSLAVWMGGVVLELDRLTKAARGGTGAYDVLQRLTGCSARVDVITGTSAGGINGAALALTQVNRDADPALLRDLWIDQGRIETLLRQPFQGQPTSLLKGDEYFLPKLNSALELLAHPPKGWPPRPRPRSTSPSPRRCCAATRPSPSTRWASTSPRACTPAASSSSVAPATRRRTTPSRSATSSARPTGWPSPPAPRPASRSRSSRRSSRSATPATRSPPAPTRCPRRSGSGPTWPDQVRSWGTGSAAADRSRYCADGGALANTPTLAALKAIEAMPATGPVRRVMLLVFPHAPRVGDDPPDTPAGPPTFAGSLDRPARGAHRPGQPDLRRGAREAQPQRRRPARHPQGRAGRAERSRRPPGADRAHLPAVQAAAPLAGRAGPGRLAHRHDRVRGVLRANQPLPGWSFDRVRAAAESAQDAVGAAPPPAGREPLPYAPDDRPATG